MSNIPELSKHTLIIGDCERMTELENNSVDFIVTSPPYFNAPFDYSGVYTDYNAYLSVMKKVASEMYRVLKNGRILALNIDDMLVDGIKYPITSDVLQILLQVGFRYRDRITWKKPDGYLRISRRSGVLIQNPYPMYYYPDNQLESILIVQKGRFDYRSVPQKIRNLSAIDIDVFKANRWFTSIWEITNVLPGSKLEKGIAAFPEEIPRRLITLFSYKGDLVLDPFVGSGTTMKVAKQLGRRSVGIEINPLLEETIKVKCGLHDNRNEEFQIFRRGDYNYVGNNS